MSASHLCRTFVAFAKCPGAPKMERTRSFQVRPRKASAVSETVTARRAAAVLVDARPSGPRIAISVPTKGKHRSDCPPKLPQHLSRHPIRFGAKVDARLTGPFKSEAPSTNFWRQRPARPAMRRQAGFALRLRPNRRAICPLTIGPHLARKRRTAFSIRSAATTATPRGVQAIMKVS